ncbi:large conductance mechanosensitive channel protein MscL [Novosphingobium album (ex Liu et al. 2023)]|uniref:Large-conductance mechanosensitive channel n=1 Tax=Novosphingobium album (ex Liu et al. 2023) TaxID=3031130 RepID=A0ABT5WTP8_9SPHN|nr:large conductance mechanosensitive channel protein MscL [Novosphingobium album (ex Liu et al. 2023)]MDE8653263.1 large conductance mechanosensitive channel protein MscL [Novosphingobium album (ex Liu et al. 2023)]
MLQEFKAFISRGNVLDLAVGVIIGAAFGKIVTSLTESVIMPFIGWITGGTDFTNHFVLLSAIPESFTGDRTNYAALKEAGVAMIGYGDFLTQLVNFLILAWIIFLIVKAANRLNPPAPAAPAGPSEADLLAEIRDELKKRPV